MKKEVIIIISPNATRTGAPLLLLTYLKWLSEYKSLEYLFFFANGGELIPDFQKLGKVYVWDRINPFRSNFKPLNLVLRVLKQKTIVKRFIDNRLLRNIAKKYSCKVAISNTSINNQQVDLIKNIFNCNVITYVHEGYKYLKSFNLKTTVADNFKKSEKLIAVSEYVKEMLITKYQETREISVIPGCVNEDRFCIQTDDIESKHGIPPDKRIVMCCAWIGWHKGSDLFIQTVIQLSKINDDLHFIWVGGNRFDLEYKQMLFDIDMLNLHDRITFVFSVENSLTYINLADIFLVLSREESFSLVTIEAGFLGKPILCFENSGGPCEIIENDNRFLIPYADVNKLSTRILELSKDKEERDEMGLYLKNIVNKHYSINQNASRLFEIIKEQS